MLKKIITTAVLGVSALGVMAANATTPGVYVTGQLGYANTHMGNKTTITDMNKNLPYDAVIKSVDPKFSNLANNGLAGRLALGYQFNQNFALELGYLNFASKKAGGIISIPGYQDSTVTLKLSQNAIDLAAKGILPLSDQFNVYGKLGVTYLTTRLTAKEDAAIYHYSGPVSYDLAGIAQHRWAPEAAIGVSYDITPNVSVDTSWTHIQPVGKNRPGNIDFVAVGLGYHFG